MKKVTYINTLNYTYDPKHPISHYRIEGSDTYKNGGELRECIAKKHRGLYTSDKNPTTSFRNGSDIESQKASIKSSGSSLGRNLQGNTAHELIAYFFANVASILFIYVILNEETQEVTEYHMNKSEFGAFVNQFAFLHYESGNHKLKINFKNTSKKMIAWLEERCA